MCTSCNVLTLLMARAGAAVSGHPCKACAAGADSSEQDLQAKLRAAEADIVKLQLTAQGHALGLNHVDEVRGMKSKMAELAAELESLRVAKAEAGECAHGSAGYFDPDDPAF